MNGITLRPPIRARRMFGPATNILCKDRDLQPSRMMIEVSMRVITTRHQLVHLQRRPIHILGEERIHVLVRLDPSIQDMDLILEMQQFDHTLRWGFIHNRRRNDLVHQLGILLRWRNLGREPTHTRTVDIARDERHADLAVVGKVLKTRDKLVALSLVCLGYEDKWEAEED